MKKFLGIFLPFMLIMGMFSITAFASEEYALYVNGEQFTSEKTTIACGSGTAEFDAATNTLTLTNATVTNVFGYQYSVINSSLPNLTINLAGDNVLDGTNNTNDGIDADGGCNITITGNGTLTIKDAYYGTYIGYYDVDGADLTIKDTTVDVINPSAAGIWVNHDISFINSTVTVTKESNNYNGIVSNVDGTLTVTESDVTVSAKRSAIHMGNTDASSHTLVLNSGSLTLTSEDYGIHVEPNGETGDINAALQVNGGTLEISSGTGGTNIPADKITFASGVDYQEGTSLADSGDITVAKSSPEPQTKSETIINVHVTYTVTGEKKTFNAEDTDNDALAAAKNWLTEIGADLSTMVLVDSKTTFTGVTTDDGTPIILVGDISDISGAYETQNVIYHYTQDDYYEVTAALKNAETPDKPVYSTVSGGGQNCTRNSGEDLTFTVKCSENDTTTFRRFTGIEIDGEAVDESNYTDVSGSVIITLNSDYVDTLAAGTHTLKALFNDGETSTEFTVLDDDDDAQEDINTDDSEDTESTAPDTPKTGDNDTTLLIYLTVFVIAAILFRLLYKSKIYRYIPRM